MHALLKLQSLAWPLRLLLAVALGVAATRFAGGWFANMHLTLMMAFGWQPWDVEMIVYASFLELLVSSIGAFVAAAVFGRHELAVAVLAFVVEGTIVDHWLQQLLGDLDGAESYVEALQRGHLDGRELAVMLVGDGLLYGWFGAFLAYILRKYREARIFEQLSRAMPPRWTFELGGGALCAVSILLVCLLLWVGVSEYLLVIDLENRPWYLPPALMLIGGLWGAAWFARLFPLGRRVYHANRPSPDEAFDIVLIRSFRDDGAACMPRYGVPLLGFVLKSLDGRSISDVVTSALARHGRVLTLGDPLELVGGGGAMRPYFPATTEDWRAYVERSLREARLIVVLPNAGAGVTWEMTRVRDLGLLGKTFAVLPPVAQDVGDTAEDRGRRWDALAALGDPGEPPSDRRPLAISWEAESGVTQVPASNASFGGFRRLVDEVAQTRAMAAGLTPPSPDERRRGSWAGPTPRGLRVVFGLAGRLDRLRFALGLAALMLSTNGLRFGLSHVAAAAIPAWALLLLGYVAVALALAEAAGQLSLLVRRLHDLGRPAWHAVFPILLVMVVAPLVDALVAGRTGVFVVSDATLVLVVGVLALWPGQAGPNRFGPDPRARPAAEPAPGVPGTQ